MHPPSRDRVRRILVLALPIIGGMVSQNVLNLVDAAMVGSQGDAALAATGTGGFVNFMAVALVIGVSSGVQAMASRRKGEGRLDEMAVPLNGGLLLAVTVGIPLTAVAWLAAPAVYSFVNGDPAVQQVGIPYLRFRLLAMSFAGMNYAFRGFWNGIDRSGVYMRSLMGMHALNIFLNWVLIYGKLGIEAQGAVGAGQASAIATAFGTLLYVLQGWAIARPHGFLRGLPDVETLRTMVRLAVPSGIQQLLFAGGMTALFKIIGLVGTAETAVSTVLINFMLVALLPGIALGITAATLVGQALGEKKPDQAYQWGWDVIWVAWGVMGLIGGVLALFPGPLLRIFLHDPATLALGMVPLRVLGVAMVFDAAGLVLMNALLGAGAAKRTAVVSIGLQWALFLPAAYIVGPVLGGGLTAIWVAQACYRALQTGVFIYLWQRRDWVDIKV